MKKKKFIEYQKVLGAKWQKAKIADVALTISPSLRIGLSSLEQNWLMPDPLLNYDCERLFLEWTESGFEIEIYDIRYPGCSSYREQRDEMEQHSCEVQ